MKKHQNAMIFAQYSLAAHKQGKYKEMYHYIMEKQDTLYSNPNLPLEYIEKLDLDIEQFRKDAKSPEVFNQIIFETKQLIESDIEEIAVPKFLIQGKELWTFDAKRNIEDFSRIIESEIKK
tara:strand:- start:426 stop:788 length:363 start_codon:yes stop_codon:yes gene_type:complete